MKNHLYSAKLSKIFWFIKRFGIKELFLKPIRIIFAGKIIKNKKIENFYVDNREYNLFYHKYNTTWSNERAVEIPLIIKEVLSEKGKVLEIGNVLKHYFKGDWKVVDKYEKGEGIINEDINTYSPKDKFDLIISISTFEHIGFDDSIGNSKIKIMEVFNRVKSLLKKNGKLIITIPLGYNPDMDSLIKEKKIIFDKEIFLKKVSKNKWIQVKRKDLLEIAYGKPFSYANYVMIGYSLNL